MRGLIMVGGWDGREFIGDDRPLLIFEPQAEPFKALRENVPDAELVRMAVGSKVCRAIMHTAIPSHSSSLLPPREASFATSEMVVRFKGSEEVAMTTLDAYLHGDNGYDTLRIDTQGYELEVLRGAEETLKHIDRIEIELHDPTVYAGVATLGEIDSFLDAHGFQRTEIDVERSDGLGDCVYEKR